MTEITNFLLAQYQTILSNYPRQATLSITEIVESIIHYHETILSCIPGNVYWFDNTGITLGCSKNVLDMFGLKSHAEFKGLTFEDLGRMGNWPLEAEKSFKQDTFEVLKSGKPKLNIKEPPIPHADGRIIYFLTSRVPIIDNNGRIIGLVGISTDISELTSMQESLKIANEKTETANQALLLVASSIAHELRTPLSAMSSGMEGIIKHLPKLIAAYESAKESGLPIDFIPNHQINALKAIATNLKNEVNYANLMINMLLVKVKQPKSSKTQHICSINDCIQKALARYPLSVEERQLIHWQSEFDFQFKGDELLIIHVFFNLLKNALYYIKAADKGKIKIWTEHNTLYNKVYFQDTGKGIAEKILPNIFDNFYSKTQGGTGVGLAFCKSVMTDLNGTITCASIEGEYSLFTLIFPATLDPS